MCNAPDYTIHRHHHHFGWDNSIVPVQTVAPGTTLEFECIDSSGGQITPESTTADIAKLDFAKINPVSGPIFIDGGRAGAMR